VTQKKIDWIDIVITAGMAVGAFWVLVVSVIEAVQSNLVHDPTKVAIWLIFMGQTMMLGMGVIMTREFIAKLRGTTTFEPASDVRDSIGPGS
jgi:hypothetical protein